MRIYFLELADFYKSRMRILKRITYLVVPCPHLLQVYSQLTLHCCRALVEVKPLLYVMDDTETVAEGKSLTRMGNSSFQHESWHDSCFNRFIVNGMICAVVLSVTNETAVRLCSEFLAANQKSEDIQNLISERQMERIFRFCIYLLDKILGENSFFWEEIVVSYFFHFLIRFPIFYYICT